MPADRTHQPEGFTEGRARDPFPGRISITKPPTLTEYEYRRLTLLKKRSPRERGRTSGSSLARWLRRWISHRSVSTEHGNNVHQGRPVPANLVEMPLRRGTSLTRVALSVTTRKCALEQLGLTSSVDQCQGKVSTTQMTGTTHQVFIDMSRCLAAFMDRPDHKRLTTPTIPGRENSLDGSVVAAITVDGPRFGHGQTQASR